MANGKGFTEAEKKNLLCGTNSYLNLNSFKEKIKGKSINKTFLTALNDSLNIK